VADRKGAPPPGSGADLTRWERLQYVAQYAAMLVAVFAVLGGIVLAVVVGIRVFEGGEIDPGEDPIDNIFSSRAVIAAIRIAILFAALYVTVSAIALIAARRWPSQVGPLQISESARRLQQESEDLRRLVEKAGREVGDLQTELMEANRVIDRQQENLEALLTHLDSTTDSEDK
jgi:hypothetical protein